MNRSRAEGGALPSRSLVFFALAAAVVTVVTVVAPLASCRRGPAPEASPRFGGLDVVLVTVDTLRSDATGFGGSPRVKTPNMDRLAAAGLVFTDAHAHNVVTLPSHANILTGVLPFVHGIRDNAGFRLAEGVPTLASRLKEKGYATGAFVAAAPLDARYGLGRGFDVYDDRYGKGKDDFTFRMPQRAGTEVVAAALAWWDSQPAGRRFLWVHLFEPHAPYTPPPPFDAEYRDAPYLGEVAAADAALAPVVSRVLDAPAAPVLAILTADHGESLGEHGEMTHGLFAYEATLKVPLVAVAAGSAAGVTAGRSGVPVSHVDIVPTILAAVGLPPDPSLPGRRLFGAAASPQDGLPRAHYFESLSARVNRGWAPLTGVLRGGLKYVDLPIRELYDLGTDPGEAANLAPSRGREVADLARLLPAGASDPGRREKPSSEEAARLRSLGYVSGSDGGRKTFTEADDPKRLVDADRKLQEMVDSYSKGDLPAAIRTGEELVRAYPRFGTAIEQLAFCYQEAGRLPDAARVLRAALALEERANLRTRLGLVLAEMGRSREAAALLAPLAASEDPDALNALAIAQSDSGEAEKAVSTLAAALKADPGNALAYQNLGIVRLRQGRPAEAREALEKALALNPALPGALNALAAVEVQGGNPARALELWQRALAVRPNDRDILFNVGVTAAKAGRGDLARAALSRYLAIRPGPDADPDVRRARELLASLGPPGPFR